MTIDDKSKLTLGIAISMASFAFWIGTAHSKGTANTEAIAEQAILRVEADRRLADRLTQDERTFTDAIQRISKIEGQVQYIYDATRSRQR